MVSLDNKIALPLKVNPTLKKWAIKQAKKEGKKLSPYIESLIEKEKKQISNQ